VVRGLSFEQDAKAIEALKQWRFQRFEGWQAVNVQIGMESDFTFIDGVMNEAPARTSSA
jgi:hypothetical protein